MTDTITSENIDLSSWDILYNTVCLFFRAVQCEDFLPVSPGRYDFRAGLMMMSRTEPTNWSSELLWRLQSSALLQLTRVCRMQLPVASVGTAIGTIPCPKTDTLLCIRGEH